MSRRAGLLPAGLYGPAAIPTLLGNDGTTAGNYYNDHPVGPQATLGAVGVASNFLYTANGCGSHGKYDCLKIDQTKTNYVAFAAHYGAPSIISNGHGAPVALPDTNPANAYLLCTTCHTPHSMYVASANADAPIDGLSAGKYPELLLHRGAVQHGLQPESDAGLFRHAVLPPVPLPGRGWFERSQRNHERHDCFLIGLTLRGREHPPSGLSRQMDKK